MTGGERPEAIVLHRIAWSLPRPHGAAHGEERIREVILVEARPVEGESGWGECSALTRPTYTGEYLAGAWTLLRDELVPTVLAGRAPEVVGHPMASAAVEAALTDLVQRRLGRSLVDSVAARLGPVREAVDRTAVVGLGSPDEVVAEVDAARDSGVAAVKLKVTGRPADLAVVETVREEFPELPVAVDGNGRLDRRAVARLDDLGLLYIEQPAPADDPVESARWARGCRTPFALDETIASPGSVDVVAGLGAGRIVNVKPARLGGIEAAIETIQRAGDHDLGVFVGGMLESGVGRAWALALAASRRCDLPTDLGPSDAYGDRDVSTDPITLDDHGRVLVPRGPGIGVEIDRGRLEEMTVDRVRLT